MDRRETELVLLLLLACAGGILAAVFGQWLFVGIFAAEVGWTAFLMTVLLRDWF
jgi:hypothetical protein